MKVLSWNTGGRTGSTRDAQLAEVLKLAPDVIALQEIVRGSHAFWVEGLRSEGYRVVTSGPEHYQRPGPYLELLGRRARRRKNLNLVASKHSVTRLPGPNLPDLAEGWPERHLVGRLDVDGTAVDVHNVHVPPGSRVGMLKVAFFEAMVERLGEPTSAARVLCGDFNSPRSESDDGFVVGGRRSDPDEKSRWKGAELAFLDHPEMKDVYRARRRRGEAFPVSYRRGQDRTACRYDHIYVSQRDFDLGQSECVYLEELLDRGLSDHAPLLAGLRLLPKERLTSDSS